MQPPEAVHLRRALSEFATGVTIVATEHDGQPVGFACQSFSSLSLEPPLVLFTVMRTSRSWPRIKETGQFAVSVLTEEHRPISEVFGRSNPDKFAHGTWERTPNGNPILEGCAVWFDCLIEQVVPAGDHYIVIGRVCGLGQRIEQRPLVYHRSSYAKLITAGQDAKSEELWRQRPSV